MSLVKLCDTTVFGDNLKKGMPMCHKLIFLLSMFLFIKPAYSVENYSIWDLEVEFSYSDVVAKPHEQVFEMKLCNQKGGSIDIVNYLGDQKPNYKVTLEFKDKRGDVFFQEDAFVIKNNP